MKKSLILRLIAVVGLAGLTTNCTTTSYDAYGNPRQTVDPGAALLGAAAVGLVGYALADGGSSRNRNHSRNYGHSSGHHSNHGSYSHHPHNYSNHSGHHYTSNRGSNRYCR